MKTTFKTSIITLVATAFSMNVHGQIISQILGGSSLSEFAIEIQNNTNNTIPSSAQFRLTCWYQNNKSYSSDFVIPLNVSIAPGEVVVLGNSNNGAVKQHIAGLCEYIIPQVGGSFRVAADEPIALYYRSSSSQSFTLVDQLGDISATKNVLWGSTSSGGNTKINTMHWERETEFMGPSSAFLGNTSWNVSSGGNGDQLQTSLSSGLTVGAFSIPVNGGIEWGVKTSIVAEDAEGFGWPTSSHKYTSTGWKTYGSTATGLSLPSVNVGASCVLSSDNALIPINTELTTTPALLVAEQNDTKISLGTYTDNNSSEIKTSQIKLKRNAIKTRGTSSVRFETIRYFKNGGWQLMGTPYTSGWQPEDFNGFGKFTWWDGGNWQIGEYQLDGAGVATLASCNLPTDGRSLMVNINDDVNAAYRFASSGEDFVISSGDSGKDEIIENLRLGTSASLATTPTNGVLHTLTTLSSGPYSSEAGWNAISNPFNCALSWKLIWDDYKSSLPPGAVAEIDATITIYNPSNNEYYDYNADLPTPGPSVPGKEIVDGLIEPGGGFFIRVNEINTVHANTIIDINIDNHGVLNYSTSSFNKSQNKNEGVILTLSSNYMNDYYHQIIDRQNASSNYDKSIDSWLQNYGSASQAILYSVEESDGDRISLNNVDLSNDEEILLGLEGCLGSELYTISANNLGDNFYSVILEDTQLDVFSDISNGFYSFTESNPTNKNRFVLHTSFTTSIGVSERLDKLEPYIYIDGNELHINPNSNTLTNVVVRDLLGKELTSRGEIDETTMLTNLNIHGLYTVQMNINNSVLTKKIIF